eukprot:Lithocolla_globosa_v1_NODE_310_length_4558_cov_56.456362.p2 type:complete len:300 gc:universal NODE_310_length_4558_cov_56.456362:1761-2660(+)
MLCSFVYYNIDIIIIINILLYMTTYYTDKQILYINSRDRDDLINDSDTDFKIKLNISQSTEFTHVVLLDASIPKSAYTISQTNNTFTVTEEIDSLPTDRLIVMPSGNYTRNSFKRILKEKLNENDSTYVYDISYSNINLREDDGKYVFSWSNINETAQEPVFTFTNQIYEACGFSKNSVNTFYGQILVSTSVTNLKPEGTYFLISDITQDNGSTILQNIINSGTYDFNYVVFYNPSPEEYSKKFVRNRQNVFHFKLADENFHQVDTNGLNIVFTVLLYKENQLNSMLSTYIKYKILDDK